MQILKSLNAAFVAIFCLTGQAQSQNQAWQFEPYLEDGVFFDTLHSPDKQVSFVCAGTYPNGDPIQLEGDGITQPYTIEMRFSGLDIIAEGSGNETYLRHDIAIVSGGKGFRIPELMNNEMIGEWQGALAFGDPLIREILNDGGFLVQDQNAVLARFSKDGLATGLLQILRACDAHWSNLAKPVPQGEMAFVNALRTGVPQPISGPVLAPPQSPIQRTLPEGAVMAALLADAAKQCNGQPEFEPRAIWQSDFDQDGIQDLVFDWRDVKCTTGPNVGMVGGGFCGASHCSIDAFLSSRIAAGLPKVELLGIGFGVEAAHPTDIMLGLGLSECHYAHLEPECFLRLRWDGSEFNDPAK